MTKPNPNATDEAPPEATESGRKKMLADRRRKLDRLRNEFELDPYGQRIDGLISLAQARAAYDEAADNAHREADAALREAKKAGTPDDQLPGVPDDRAIVSVAGRVMQHRVMGNLIFVSLRDDTGDLQIAISKKAVGQPSFGIAKQTDLSDIIAVRGALGVTNTGELTLWAAPNAAPHADAERSEASGTPAITDPLSSGFCFQTKSLALPPGKHHGLTDPETRYRKRYVDLHTNTDVMDTMQKRIQIIDTMRDYLRDKGYLEVETPMLQSLHGGAAARPFKTHHNALDLPLTMRIAPELYLKRLLVGGMRKVFEINRNFRNEGISPRHNPEFTMLEAYDAYGDWQTMANLVEDMVCTVAEKVIGTLIIEHKAEGASAPGSAQDDSNQDNNAKTPSRQAAKKAINLTKPWRRISMVDLVEERTGWKFEKKPIQDSCAGWFDALLKGAETRCDFYRVQELLPNAIDPTEDEIKTVRSNAAHSLADGIRNHFSHTNLSPAEQLTEVYEKLIEPTLIDPTFVTRVPGVIIPLAKRCKDDDYFADVYELAINGVEISPGYTELNDPDIQEHHFREQVGDAEEQQQIDEDFLEALRVGMPPAGGIGLGIDRLVMMLTGATSIRDVILFPLMRPQGKD